MKWNSQDIKNPTKETKCLLCSQSSDFGLRPSTTLNEQHHHKLKKKLSVTSFQYSWTGEEVCTVLQTEVLTGTCPFERVQFHLPTLGAVLRLTYGLPVHGGEVRFSQINREGSLYCLGLHMLLLSGRVYVVNTPRVEGTDGFLKALKHRSK